MNQQANDNHTRQLHPTTSRDKKAPQAWQYEMQGHAEQCVERYIALTGHDVESLLPVSTPCMDDHQFRPDELVAKGEISDNAARIVFKCLYLARFGRPDTLWSVSFLARMVTKWIQACEKRLHRLIAYIHHTKHWTQVCHIGDQPWECWLALFVDASFAGDITDSKSTSGSYLCLVGPSTFVPLSWMCKKQGAVSHSSAEAEVIALDAATRMEGIPALGLWEMVLEVFPDHSHSNNTTTTPHPVSAKGIQRNQHHSNTTKFDTNQHNDIDYVPSNIPVPRGLALLMIFEDNEAVIKMAIKGRSPHMQHVPRTHRS
jgi:hypothetical protein